MKIFWSAWKLSIKLNEGNSHACLKKSIWVCVVKFHLYKKSKVKTLAFKDRWKGGKAQRPGPGRGVEAQRWRAWDEGKKERARRPPPNPPGLLARPREGIESRRCPVWERRASEPARSLSPRERFTPRTSSSGLHLGRASCPSNKGVWRNQRPGHLQPRAWFITLPDGSKVRNGRVPRPLAVHLHLLTAGRQVTWGTHKLISLISIGLQL